MKTFPTTLVNQKKIGTQTPFAETFIYELTY